MLRLLIALFVLILSGCSTKTVYIEPDAELIPKEQALAFLRSEEVASPYITQAPCVFTRVGVYNATGYSAYDDTYFYVRSVINGYHVWVGKKGSLEGCIQYSGPLDQDLFNKISTSLVSLGLEQTKGLKWKN